MNALGKGNIYIIRYTLPYILQIIFPLLEVHSCITIKYAIVEMRIALVTVLRGV